MFYRQWSCSAGPKAFPSHQTLLTQKWKAVPWNLHLDPKQLIGTGEALEKQVPSGVPCFQMLFFVSLVNFNGTHLGLFNLLFFNSLSPLLCSFLPLSNPKYLVFSPFSTLAQHTSAFPPLPMHGSLPLHPSPPPVLHPFALVSSTYTISPTFSFHSLHPHLLSSMLSPSVFYPLSLPPVSSKPVFPSVLSSSFLPWCHFNYWPILCSLSSLSLTFPLFSPLGTQACLSLFCSRDAVAVGFQTFAGLFVFIITPLSCCLAACHFTFLFLPTPAKASLRPSSVSARHFPQRPLLLTMPGDVWAAVSRVSRALFQIDGNQKWKWHGRQGEAPSGKEAMASHRPLLQRRDGNRAGGASGTPTLTAAP